jgi:hypothetical protein
MSQILKTTLAITPKVDNSNLKKYFDSLKRNLPEKWFWKKDEPYNDDDTFYIIESIICLQTPYYKAVSSELIFYGKIFLALTDYEIFIVKLETHDLLGKQDLEKSLSIEEKLNGVHQFIEILHENILKSKKNYYDFNYDFQFGGPQDENYFKDDIRDERSLKLHSKEDGKSYNFQKGKHVNYNDKKIYFFVPNNISLSLSLMKKAYKKAKITLPNLLTNRNDKVIKLKIQDKKINYDYFEEIITSIIFAYISVEAFSNAVIPTDFKYERYNEKKVKETWSKENIERWLTTSQKISEILPIILNTKDIKTETFWLHFKELEKLRNDIIHQKTIEDGTILNSEIYTELLNPDVFRKIKSALAVIKFFYDYDNAHPYFPLGLGLARFQIKEVANIEDELGKLKELD